MWELIIGLIKLRLLESFKIFMFVTSTVIRRAFSKFEASLKWLNPLGYRWGISLG